jgi:hypothetical protein
LIPGSAIENGECSKNKTVIIPNYIFLESWNIGALLVRDTSPVYLTVIAEKYKSKHDLIKNIMDEIRLGRIDYFFTESFAIPLKIWTDWSILLPQHNRATFNKVYVKENSYLFDQSKSIGKEMLESINMGFSLENRSLIEENCYAICQLTNVIKDMFLVEPEKIAFFCLNYLVWKKVKTAIDNDSFANKVPTFSEKEACRIFDIENKINEGKVSEAFFMAKNLLLGKFDRPKKLKVSVLVVTRNRGDSLRKTLESIINQTLKPYEIVVVDNGSTDKTKDIVFALSRKHPEIKYIVEKKIGIPFARNRAVKESSSDTDIVAFIDDDCRAENDWLHELILPFEYDEEIVSIGGDISFNEEDLTIGGAFYHFRKLDRYIK